MPVLLQNRQRSVSVDVRQVARMAETILCAAGVDEAELSLLLVSDQQMRSLNARFRKKNRPTDVLAFPLLENDSLRLRRHSRSPSRRTSPADPPTLLGDVVIAMPTAKRQANEHGRGILDEMRRLLVHGVLHLLGFDHEHNHREAARMMRKQRAILRTIGLRVHSPL